jgi:hypothetical protein
MSTIVQALTLKVQSNHDEALEEIKRLKKFLAGKGATVRAFWAIEAGGESGTGTVAIEFPSAAAWAALVDSNDPELQAMRRRGAEAPGVVVSSGLYQEVDLS